MSVSYFMLKMLSKDGNKRKLLKCNKIPQPTPIVKSINTFTPDNHKCRVCLQNGNIPIYSGECTFDLPDAIRKIGGVEINENDDLPKHICKDCHSLLQGAVIFRNSARESDEFLRHAPRTFALTPTNCDNNAGSCFESHKKRNTHSYMCKSCKINFKTIQAYSAHKIKRHKNVRIQCRICLKLMSPQLYEKHLSRHQSTSHLICEVCGKLYRKDNLVRHLQLHNNELPFQCQICPYRGRFKESLKIHMRTHSGDRPFSCNNCDLRFITKSNLNRHLLTHVKEKPHKCVECNRGFYTQKDLDVHLRADHIGVKEFSCRVCGNKYGTKKALMRHELRVHKREKMAKGRMPLYLQAEFQNSKQLLSLIS